MKWLQAAMAFALIMLVFATIVTIVLETAYRVLLTREQGFRLMMARLFDEVLRPRVAHLLRGVTVADARQQFLGAVTRNQAYEEQRGWLRRFIQPSELASMTMMQFADRLADTEVGKAIARNGAAYVETAINDLAQKFDRFGAAASQRFQDQARFWCVLVSVLLAFVANVDAIRVFQQLLGDDTLRSSVIARYGAAVDERAQRPQDLAQSLQVIAELHAQGVVSKADFEAFRSNVASAQLKFAELRESGLPITIESWPFCTGVMGNTGRDAVPPGTNGMPPMAPAAQDAAPKPADRKCSGVTPQLRSIQGVRDVAQRLWSTAGGAWLLAVILAGALIGLGAPFWFDLARSMTRGAQLLRGSGVASRPEKPVMAEGKAPPPRTPVEAFRVAIAASRSDEPVMEVPHEQAGKDQPGAATGSADGPRG